MMIHNAVRTQSFNDSNALFSILLLYLPTLEEGTLKWNLTPIFCFLHPFLFFQLNKLKLSKTYYISLVFEMFSLVMNSIIKLV